MRSKIKHLGVCVNGQDKGTGPSNENLHHSTGTIAYSFSLLT